MKENKTELITNLIQENSKISDVIGTVKSAENIKITPNPFSFVIWNHKSNIIGKKAIPVIFQHTFDLSLELTLTGNLVKLNSSKSRLIKIPVFNHTAKDTFIRSGSLMGNLERVLTAIPLELKLIEIAAAVSKIEVDIEAPKNKTKWLPGNDLYHLFEDQRVENLLLDECDVFSKNDIDIETIESFKLKLNVTDLRPV